MIEIAYLAPYATISLILALNVDGKNFYNWVWGVSVFNFYLSGLLFIYCGSFILINYIDHWAVNTICNFVLSFMIPNLIAFSFTALISSLFGGILCLLKNNKYKWIKPKRKKRF
jgi:hypothetical protein